MSIKKIYDDNELKVTYAYFARLVKKYGMEEAVKMVSDKSNSINEIISIFRQDCDKVWSYKSLIGIIFAYSSHCKGLYCIETILKELILRGVVIKEGNKFLISNE